MESSTKRLQFPNGFLWGSACASYQVEGNIENCDWAEAAREGKVPACGQADDHYNRYEGDFDLAKNLGHNCHRLSIEWARIEPEEGKFDYKEAEHYRNVINALRARGMEPFVTIWHFTLPIWFANDGGFENRKSVMRFKKYCEFVAKEILQNVTFIQTMNEPMVWIGNGYMRGKWLPLKIDRLGAWRALRNLIKAHNAAYPVIKSACPNALVSIAKNNMYFDAIGLNPLNYIKSAFSTYMWNFYFLEKTKDQLDFIGLNFYKTHIFGGSKLIFPKTDMGWNINPSGIYSVLLQLKKYNKIIYITENGLADSSDKKREKFISDHLVQIHKAIHQGVDVRGFFYWSLLDNYEWAEGFKERFGLIEVDFLTQARKIRPSALAYKNIIENNALVF